MIKNFNAALIAATTQLYCENRSEYAGCSGILTVEILYQMGVVRLRSRGGDEVKYGLAFLFTGIHKMACTKSGNGTLVADNEEYRMMLIEQGLGQFCKIENIGGSCSTTYKGSVYEMLEQAHEWIVTYPE
jgi:hypothetical protein